MSDRDIVARIKDLGVDYPRLKAALDNPDNWGGMVNAFEYLTVLGVVCDAMAAREPRPPRPEPTDEELMAIINAWVEPGRVHVPGCVLTDLESYCLDCHVTASNALDEMKRRRGEEDTD